MRLFLILFCIGLMMVAVYSETDDTSEAGTYDQDTLIDRVILDPTSILKDPAAKEQITTYLAEHGDDPKALEVVRALLNNPDPHETVNQVTKKSRSPRGAKSRGKKNGVEQFLHDAKGVDVALDGDVSGFDSEGKVTTSSGDEINVYKAGEVGLPYAVKITEDGELKLKDGEQQFDVSGEVVPKDGKTLSVPKDSELTVERKECAQAIFGLVSNAPPPDCSVSVSNGLFKRDESTIGKPTYHITNGKQGGATVKFDKMTISLPKKCADCTVTLHDTGMKLETKNTPIRIPARVKSDGTYATLPGVFLGGILNLETGGRTTLQNPRQLYSAEQLKAMPEELRAKASASNPVSAFRIDMPKQDGTFDSKRGIEIRTKGKTNYDLNNVKLRSDIVQDNSGKPITTLAITRPENEEETINVILPPQKQGDVSDISIPLQYNPTPVWLAELNNLKNDVYAKEIEMKRAYWDNYEIMLHFPGFRMSDLQLTPGQIGKLIVDTRIKLGKLDEEGASDEVKDMQWRFISYLQMLEDQNAKFSKKKREYVDARQNYQQGVWSKLRVLRDPQDPSKPLGRGDVIFSTGSEQYFRSSGGILNSLAEKKLKGYNLHVEKDPNLIFPLSIGTSAETLRILKEGKEPVVEEIEAESRRAYGEKLAAKMKSGTPDFSLWSTIEDGKTGSICFGDASGSLDTESCSKVTDMKWGSLLRRGEESKFTLDYSPGYNPRFVPTSPFSGEDIPALTRVADKTNVKYYLSNEDPDFLEVCSLGSGGCQDGNTLHIPLEENTVGTQEHEGTHFVFDDEELFAEFYKVAGFTPEDFNTDNEEYHKGKHPETYSDKFIEGYASTYYVSDCLLSSPNCAVKDGKLVETALEAPTTMVETANDPQELDNLKKKVASSPSIARQLEFLCRGATVEYCEKYTNNPQKSCKSFIRQEVCNQFGYEWRS